MSRFIIILRSLFRNRTTTVITIAGFSISISMALVLIAFLINEFSIDRDYPHINNIYRVLANDNITSVREEFREQLIHGYPAIDDACRYNNYSSILTFNDRPFSGKMIVTDSSFFSIFSSEFISGTAGSSFDDPGKVVLTESFAGMIFGDEDPLGSTIIAEYKEPLVVSGIVRDFPPNSSIQGDFFTNSRKRIKYEGSSDGQGNEVAYFRLFIKVNDEASVSDLEELLSRDLSAVEYKVGYPVEKIRLIPFAKSYFTQGLDRSQTQHANLKLIKLLIIITSAIIILAILNFVNLSTASHTDRYREIAIKKTIGASGRKIFVQFMSESFLVCFISFLAALLLSSVWLPYFEDFLGKTVSLSILFNVEIILWLCIGVFIIAFIAGIYPALAISGLKPVVIFRKTGTERKGSVGLRAGLNIFQNTVSVSLIIALIVLLRQINYVKTKDFGFSTDQIVRVDVHWRLEEKAPALREKLLREPSVYGVSFSHGTPGSIYATSSWDFNGEEGIINRLTVDTAFFEVFRIQIIQGRDLMASDFKKVCYLNETAFKKTGWDTFEGHKYRGKEIIGIVRDFHFASLYNEIAPLALVISDEMGISHATLRLDQGNIPGTIKAVSGIWKEIFPDFELKYRFYDDWLDSMYNNEEKLAAALGLFSVLAIIIACLGVFGLAEFSIRKRTREIGLRKVNGARVSQVMVLLNIGFIRWIFYAIVIAIPVSYFILNRWLSTFAYRTSLSWWIFVAGALAAIIIAIITVSWQSWRAASRNPVEALRYE